MRLEQLVAAAAENRIDSRESARARRVTARGSDYSSGFRAASGTTDEGEASLNGELDASDLEPRAE